MDNYNDDWVPLGIILEHNWCFEDLTSFDFTFREASRGTIFNEVLISDTTCGGKSLLTKDERRQILLRGDDWLSFDLCSKDHTKCAEILFLTGKIVVFEVLDVKNAWFSLEEHIAKEFDFVSTLGLLLDVFKLVGSASVLIFPSASSSRWDSSFIKEFVPDAQSIKDLQEIVCRCVRGGKELFKNSSDYINVLKMYDSKKKCDDNIDSIFCLDKDDILDIYSNESCHVR
jgi:hypothetical protein